MVVVTDVSAAFVDHDRFVRDALATNVVARMRRSGWIEGCYV